MASSLSDSFIRELESSLENNDFHNCELRFSDDPGPSGGFVANTYVADLKGTNNIKETKTLQVFIKCGKEENIFQGMIDTDMACDREICMFSRVFPTLKAFLDRENISFNFDFIPKCYRAVRVQNIPVLVLENLLPLGFKLHDTMCPMDMDHMRLVYDNYAKLHAASFAFKEKDQKEYEELTRCMTPIEEEFWTREAFDTSFENHNEKTCKMLSDSGHAKLMDRWKKYLEKGSINIFRETAKFRVTERAITHTDCWNNNFMFKYKADDIGPSNVKLLDFQISHIQSPVVDLCSYFYLTCSSETVKYFDDLILFYHQRFSTYMYELGSDPEKAFPFSTLKRHWREFSINPCLRNWHGIHNVMYNQSDINKCADQTEDLFFRDDYKIVDIELYKDRLVSAVKHYCDYAEKYSIY